MTSGKPLNGSASSCPVRSSPTRPSWLRRRPPTRLAASGSCGRSGGFRSGWRR